MNGRQFFLGASSNPLVQILGLVVFAIFAIGAVVMGAFVLLGIFGLAFIGFIVLAVRGWWLQRKLRKRFGGGQQGPAGQPHGRRLIEAEYEVVDTEPDEEGERRDRDRGNG